MGKLTKPRPEDMPTIDNEPSLQEWLEQQRGRLAWSVPSMELRNGIPIFILSLWVFPNGRTAIVQVSAYQNGWEIYTGTSEEKIENSLADVEIALGLPASG
jgi:hypothetical protein